MHTETLRRAVADRERPFFLVDLGMPRNVDPACSRLANVFLYNLDDLKGLVQRNMTRKTAEKQKAEALIAEDYAACMRELEKPLASRS